MISLSKRLMKSSKYCLIRLKRELWFVIFVKNPERLLEVLFNFSNQHSNVNNWRTRLLNVWRVEREIRKWQANNLNLNYKWEHRNQHQQIQIADQEFLQRSLMIILLRISQEEVLNHQPQDKREFCKIRE